MDEGALQDFRQKIWIRLIESLVLRLSLVEPMSRQGLSLQRSLQDLQSGLDDTSDQLLAIYGRELADPALVALYAEEAKEVVEGMKKTASAIAKQFEPSTEF